MGDGGRQSITLMVIFILKKVIDRLTYYILYSYMHLELLNQTQHYSIIIIA